MEKVNYIDQQMKSCWEKNKSLVYVCLAFTFLWGFVCHGYMFANNFFSHDSLNEFNADVFGNAWKIQLGRVLVPYYRKLTSTALTLPWLNGFLALFWLSITVFFVVKIYHIEKKYLIFLIAGILTTNVTVIAMTATYIHELDNNMFGVMLSVVAVYLWRKFKYGFCIGAIFVGASLGIYQSFISVTATLIIISSVLDLLLEKEFSTVLKNGINGVVMLLLGGGVYLLLIKVICTITNVPLFSGNYNSVTNLTQGSVWDYLHYIPGTYKECFNRFFDYPSLFPDNLNYKCQIVILLIMAALILCVLIKRSVGWKERILTAILIAIMPLAMNTVYVLNKAETHDLMNYAFWLIYVFAVLVFYKLGYSKKVKIMLLSRVVPFLLVFVTLWGNVQVSNMVYMKKNIEQEATLSLFTRIMYEIEQFEGFVPGQTKIVFVGEPEHLLTPMTGFEVSRKITGAKIDYMLGAASRDYYAAYFEYVLQYPDAIADQETWDRIMDSNEIYVINCYPEEKCMKLVGDVLLVKIGEN